MSQAGAVAALTSTGPTRKSTLFSTAAKAGPPALLARGMSQFGTKWLKAGPPALLGRGTSRFGELSG
jgi:hypothetical protein